MCHFGKPSHKLSVLFLLNLLWPSWRFCFFSFKYFLFLDLGCCPKFVLISWMCSSSAFLVPPHLPNSKHGSVGTQALEYSSCLSVLIDLQNHGFTLSLSVCDFQFLSPAWTSSPNPKFVYTNLLSFVYFINNSMLSANFGEIHRIENHVKRTHEDAVSKIQTVFIGQMTQFLKKKKKKN